MLRQRRPQLEQLGLLKYGDRSTVSLMRRREPLAMVRHIDRRGPQVRVLWQVDRFAVAGEEAGEFAGHAVVGDEEAVVFRDRDQVTVEEPVDRL